MEFLVASAIGTLTAGGVYLILRLRAFPVILGISMLSYAVNVFLFSTGRLAVDAPPILQKYADVPYSDPLPQALVLTAIVISFGMTAVLVMFALGAYLEADHDRINIREDDEPEETSTEGQGA
ncbi:multisubunit potassium/proton antiporter PhaC subunit [Shimia isoporae]|uniref:Multisubunit potassium/proton antiporter PhaC subunit n=1 Tax=Shimia isoporae TaxID=647720 RepID=A0A4R1N1Z3_9RHOB|nr:Na+/H+ antiporter subunit C [Shimia isoporae]TCK98952.1 multisubunit potassium/proton antiporter PhaC subunit [Shimia isoporae]